MDKKVIMMGIILLAIVFTLFFIIFPLFYGGEIEQINEQIEQANYCNLKDDCVVLDGKCPFGCYIPVNVNEGERIEELVGDYESKCVYSCIAIDGYDCVDNKCVVISEGNILEG